MTALQDEIREMELRLLDEMEWALKSRTTPYERERCRRAYYFLMRVEQDAIGQRHGLPGMLWRKI